MLKNVALFLTSLFLILALGEWLFPKILGKLPLRLYGSIDKNLRILAQSSKYSKEIVDSLNAVGANVSFVEIETDKGHDAFLLDEKEFNETVRGFLNSIANIMKVN